MRYGSSWLPRGSSALYLTTLVPLTLVWEALTLRGGFRKALLRFCQATSFAFYVAQNFLFSTAVAALQ